MGWVSLVEGRGLMSPEQFINRTQSVVDLGSEYFYMLLVPPAIIKPYQTYSVVERGRIEE